MKIVHLILGLGRGGAENMLLKLATEHAKNSNIKQKVFIFSQEETMLSLFKANNICVKNISFKTKLFNVFVLPKLIYELYRYKPNVLQCWMYHAEFLGVLAKIFYWRKLKLFWNIRCSELDWKKRSAVNKYIFMFLQKTSSFPARIICNTTKGVKNHIQAGYDPSKFKLIYNGFNLPKPSNKNLNKEGLFNQLKIPLNSRTIVMVARFNYVKDHFTLVKAFSKLIEDEYYSDVKLILIGEPANQDIESMILNSKSRDSIRLMGNINNVCETIKFFDVGVLSSLHEGFPNVIGEYILSNLIVVATDVGEVKNILNQKSPLLSSPRDCDSLKENFKVALSMTEYNKNDIITKNKDKIINNFTIENISDQYIDCYND